MFSVPFFNSIFSLSAPSNVDIVEISPTTVTVKATPPSGNPDMGVFEASMVGGTPDQKCKVRVTVDPLQCEIPNQFAFDEAKIIGQAQTKAGRLFMEAIYSDENSINRHITLDPCSVI